MEFEKDYDDNRAIQDIGLNNDLNKPITYLYNRHYDSVERYIIKNSGSTYDAEDIFQESLMVTIRSIQENKFRSESSLKSYLFAIAKNLWISELRKRKSTSIREEIYAGENDVQVDGINKRIIKNENFVLVESLFDALGDKCKRILLLFYYQELSIKEIMLEENYTSEQVLRNKKYKCLKTLTERVKSNPVLYQNIKDALKYE
jgi:RNA polymerase sigma factor (sigma-70 family)